MKNVRLDYQFLFDRIPSRLNIASSFLFFPGFRAVCIYRVQEFFNSRNCTRLALFFSNVNQIITGAEICVGARIQAPLIIRHPSGIVIGGGVRIGKECVLLHGVTIGEKHVVEPDGKYPNLGDKVVVGCNSTILGDILIGSGARIGAHTLILKAVKSNETIVGHHYD